jgi:predicted negative regulator of RcsB-dependent stress response
MTEQEQIEQLKAWIKQYGLTVLSGILIAFLMLTGWHSWQRYQRNVALQASAIYDEMLAARRENNASSLKKVATQAQQLLTHYAKTPYATLAAFELARNAIAQQNFSGAIKQLTWITDHSNSAPMRDIAKIRIARIDITEQKPEEAIAILKKIEDNNFNGLASEVQGDAYLKMNQVEKARQAYLLALQQLPKKEATERPLLQMKLDNLASATDFIS